MPHFCPHPLQKRVNVRRYVLLPGVLLTWLLLWATLFPDFLGLSAFHVGLGNVVPTKTAPL